MDINFKCAFCLHNFEQPDQLITHLYTHQLNKNEDDINLEEVEEENDYEANVSNNCNKADAFKYKCPNCQYSCDDVSRLNRHIATLHDNSRPFKCTKCNITLASKNHFLKHETRVHNKAITLNGKYPCKLCGKLFQRSKLLIHMRIHYGLKPYQCRFCNNKFRQLHHVKSHLKTVHKKHNPTSFHFSVDKETEKNPESSVTVMLSNQKNLSNSIQNQVKLHKCPKCPNFTGKHSKIMRHMSTVHDESRPFKCNKCSFAFLTLPNLRKHNTEVHNRHLFNKKGKYPCKISYTHQGRKPYKCQFCPSTFSYSSSRSKHEKTQHPK